MISTLLSKAQKTLLELLDRYDAVREDQVERLICIQGQSFGTIRVESMLQQLINHGEIKRDGRLLIKPGRQADLTLINALDIMLCLSPKGVELHQRGAGPFALSFFRVRSSRLYRYDVCPVPAGREPLVSAQLEGLISKYRVIVFVVENMKQREYLPASEECCFAIRDSNDDAYRFYRAGTSIK